MKIKVTVGQKQGGAESTQYVYNKQKVDFVYLISKELNDEVGDTTDVVPQKLPYTSTATQQGLAEKYPDNGIILMNYSSGGRIYDTISDYRQYGITTIPRDDYANAIAIYKKEIWYKYKKNSDGTNVYETNALGIKVPVVEMQEEPVYHLVTNQSNSGTVYDFNIANHRYYKYLFRFIQGGSGINDTSLTEGLKEIIVPIKVGWDGWSLTELHEKKDDSGAKYYTASLKDVWKFRNNISPGDTQQQLSKTPQDTLSRFPKFITGPKNALEGTVTCLLGRDVEPYNWETIRYEYAKDSKTGEWGWEPVLFGYGENTGGYKERLWNDVYYSKATSNPSIDMLDYWREFCYSGNPKLLKDNKGQKFIVQVHNANEHTEETWSGRPTSITFTWTQIEETDGVQILQEGE